MNESTGGLGDMPADEFRRFGYQAVDRIADYFEHIGELPVLSQVEPGWLKGQLPGEPPASGEDFAEVMADIDRLVLPAVRRRDRSTAWR